MRHRLSIILILLGALLLLCSCEEKSRNTRWQWSSKEIALPEDFGNIRSITSAEGNVFVASYTALGRYHQGEITPVDTIYSPKAPAMVYGVTSYDATVFLLTGEMLPHYTDSGEAQENPNFSGQYAVIPYRENTRGEAVTFQLSKDDQLAGILALSDEYMLCWTESDAWVISMTDGSGRPQAITGEIIAPTVSQSGAWLWVKDHDTYGYYPLSAQLSALGDCVWPEECPANLAASSSDNNGCLLNTGAALSLYNTEGCVLVPLAEWRECALSRATITNIVQVDSDTWLCGSYVENKAWVVTRQAIADGQQTLQIAAAFGTSELDALVEQFNATHTNCTAVVKYYPENAYDRLCTEIMAGNGPDVLNLYGLSLPLGSPYLEDIYPYIDSDESLDRNTFIPTVLSSLEVNGTLQSVPATYAVATLTANTSAVGDRTSWTFREMQALLAQQNRNTHLLPETWTQEEFLKWIASISTGAFVDWENHTADYNSAEFREQLQFCATLPKTFQHAEAGNRWQALAQLQVIQSPLVLQSICQQYDRPFTFIGFPCESGNGSFFECTTLHLGISSDSAKKDLAWEFVRYALLPEYQQALAETGYLSVRNDVREAQLQGEIAEEMMGEPLDSALLKQYYQLTSQPLLFIGYNEEIAQIIQDEGSSFFDGQRTVEEAAERIQNRVALYLSEIE